MSAQMFKAYWESKLQEQKASKPVVVKEMKPLAKPKVNTDIPNPTDPFIFTPRNKK